MTISSENRVAGPFLGDGIQTVLPFTFKVFSAADIKVTSTDASGVDTVLSTGFITAINADQNASPGGTVTMTVAPALNFKTTLSSAISYLQSVQIQNNGPFLPAVINDALDRLTILTQQVLNETSRSLKIPVTDGALITLLPTATVRANKVIACDALGNFTVSNLTLAVIESAGAQAAAAAASAAAALVSANNSAASAVTAGNAVIAAQAAQAAAEAAAAGMKWRPSVRASTTAALPTVVYANGASGVGATLTASANGALAAQDGVTLTVGQRLLVQNQVATLQNGVYTLTQVGTGGTPFILTRAIDADTWNELVSQVVSVEEGSTQADYSFICTVDQGGTIGTTSVTWTGFKVVIADNSVTTNKIVDANVTRAKLAAGALGTSIIGTSQTATFTASALIDFYPCNANGGVFTVNLYTAVGNSGRQIVLQKTDATFNQITIDAAGTETISGNLTDVLSTQGESLTLISDGANWYILERRIPSEWQSFTPATLAGFGTPTGVDYKRRRVGDSLEIRGRHINGTVTSTENRIGFVATGETIVSSSAISTIELCGMAVRSAGTTGIVPIIEPSVNYMTLGLLFGAGTTKQLSPTATGETVTIKAMIPIQGWKG